MSNTKCPFCNGELVGTIGHPICRNQDCVMCDDPMPQDLLEELIRTRKALEIAWDGLEKIGSGNIIEHSVVGHEDDNKIFIANKALNESKTALEQKD